MDSGWTINCYGELVYLEEVYAAMPVEKDASTYYMKHPNRGQALIFINVDSDMEEAANIDVKNFKMMCTALGLSDNQIKCYKFKERKDIDSIFNDFAKEDHTKEDCVLVVFITCEEGLASIAKHHSPYRYEGYILPQLFPDKCLSLAAKPKLIFFQVYCENTAGTPQAKDIGKPIWKKQDCDINASYKIPIPTDFLIVYSTSPAIPTIPAQGSVFYKYLSEFCISLKEMKTDSNDYDILSLLTGTMNAISHDAPQESVPMWTSTLIREVCFFSSEKSE